VRRVRAQARWCAVPEGDYSSHHELCKPERVVHDALDDAQRAVLGQARAMRRKLRFASLVALTYVIGLGTFALLSLSLGLFELNLDRS